MHRINLWTLCAISHTEFLPHYMRKYAIYRVLTPKHYVLIYALVNLMDIYNGKYILVSKPCILHIHVAMEPIIVMVMIL